MLMLYCKFM